MQEGIIDQLKIQEKFFLNTVSCLTEEDSGFKPNEEMYTVAQHIGHTAETYDWFIEGAFGSGFNMNFENYVEEMKKYTSLSKTVEQLKTSIANAIEKIKSYSEEELMMPITGEIMTGSPKMVIVYALGDHTAHNRGSLAVYARLLGKKPQMPYGEV